MSQINIQILSGPSSGRVASFDDPPITFGRSPESTIVIDAVHASREHGELVRFDGAWHVVNHSANGTTVNGRKIGDEPHALRDGDVIGVGKQKLVRVGVAPIAPAEQADQPETPAAEAASTEPKRPINKLWIGIGVYLTVMMLVFIVLSMSTDGDKDKNRAVEIPMLTDQAIADEIGRPLSLPFDEDEALNSLNKAKRFYQKRDAEADALYRAHHHFKKALAQQEDSDKFANGLDDRDFRACQKLLIERVTALYRDGYALRTSKQWDSARRQLYKLLHMYPDNDSRIHRNVSLQLEQVNRLSKRR